MPAGMAIPPNGGGSGGGRGGDGDGDGRGGRDLSAVTEASSITDLDASHPTAGMNVHGASPSHGDVSRLSHLSHATGSTARSAVTENTERMNARIDGIENKYALEVRRRAATDDRRVVYKTYFDMYLILLRTAGPNHEVPFMLMLRPLSSRPLSSLSLPPFPPPPLELDTRAQPQRGLSRRRPERRPWHDC